MKKISMLTGFMTLLMSGASMAEITPVLLDCSLEGGVHTCEVTQDASLTVDSDNVPEADNIEGQFGPFGTWNDVVSAYLDLMNYALSPVSGDATANQFVMKLGSSLVFPDHEEGNQCSDDDMNPLRLSNVVFTLDGQDHTISNFCYDKIGSEEGGFFSALLSEASPVEYAYEIKNVTFNNFFVRETVEAVPSSRAGTVVSRAERTRFSSVTVNNSKVHAVTAGGVVGECTDCAFDKVTVSGTEIAMSGDIFANEYTDNPSEIVSMVSRKGGIAGVADRPVFSSTTKVVENTTIGRNDEVKIYYISPGSLEADVVALEGGLFTGGLVGSLSTGSGGGTYQNIVVNAELGGNGVGGMFGQVDNSMKVALEISSSNVDVRYAMSCHTVYGSDLFSHDYKNIAGGLIGSIIYQTDLKILNDTVSSMLEFRLGNCDSEGAVASGRGEIGLIFGGLVAKSDYASTGEIEFGNNIVSNEVYVEYPIRLGSNDIEVTRDTIGGLVGSLNGIEFNITDYGTKFTTNNLKVKSDAELVARYETSNAIVAGSYARVTMSPDKKFVVTGTQMRHNLEVAGSAAFDFVRMGGVIATDDGNEYELVIHGISEEESPFENSILVSGTNGKDLVLGGLASHLNTHYINISENEFTSNISVTQTEDANVVIGGLLADAYGSSGTLTLFKNLLKGNLEDAVVYKDGIGYIGGLIGTVSEIETKILDCATIGNISSSHAQYQGYLIGQYYIESPSQIVGNFHYGTSDNNVEDPFGFVYDYGIDDEYTEWKDGREDVAPLGISYNYRNAVDGLEVSPGQWLWPMGAFLKDGGFYAYNGVLDAASMKSRAFAHILNKAVNDLKLSGTTLGGTLKYEWTIDEFLNDYPVFANNPENKFYAVYIDFDKVASELTKGELDAMADYMCEGYGNVFVTYRENVKSNALTDDFVDAIEPIAEKYIIADAKGNIFHMSKASPFPNLSDESLEVSPNPEVRVSYLLDDGVGVLTPVDDVEGSVFFTTPRTDRLQMFDQNTVIPDILVKRDGMVELYRANSVSYKALQEGATDPTADVSSLWPSFEEGNSFMVNKNMDGYDSEMQIKYELVPFDNGVNVSFASGAVDVPLRVSINGYNGDNLSVVKSQKAVDSQVGAVELAPRLSFDAGLGVDVQSLKLDLWISLDREQVVTPENIEECYLQATSDFCKTQVASYSSETDIESYDQTVSQLRSAILAEARAAKWTVFAPSVDPLDLTNLLNATRDVLGFGQGVSLHVHGIPEVEFLDYEITFVPDMQDFYFGDSWISDGGSFNIGSQSSEMPLVYAVDYAMNGWTASKDGSAVTSRSLNSDMLDDLELTRSENGDKNVLLGVWDRSNDDGRELRLVASADAKDDKLNGNLVLIQTYTQFDDRTEVPVEHPFQQAEDPSVQVAGLTVPVAPENMTFRVASMPKPGFRLSGLKTVDELGLETGNLTIANGDTLFKLAADERNISFVADFKAAPYLFVQRPGNSGSLNFYSRNWKDTVTYHVDDVNILDFPRQYSTRHEFEGWVLDDVRFEDEVITSFDPEDVQKYDLFLEDHDVLQLRLVGRELSVEESRQRNEFITIPEEGFVGGELFFEQSLSVYDLDEPFVTEHRFGDGGFEPYELAIPNVSETFDLVARAVTNGGYKLSYIAFSYVNRRTSEAVLDTLHDGDTFAVEPERMTDMKMDAVFEKIHYEITFDYGEQGEAKDIIFENGKMEQGDFVIDDDREKPPHFPQYVYGSETCVLGWESDLVNPETQEKFFITNLDYYSVSALKEGKNTLHAVWGDYRECDDESNGENDPSGNYSRIVLDAKGALVSIHRNVVNANGDTVEEVRHFGENNYLLIPENFDGSDYWVEFEAAPGYVALSDTMVFYRNGFREPGNFGDFKTLHNGDRFHYYLSFGVLSGEFKRVNDTPLQFVTHDVYRSGSRWIAVDFSTSEFDVDRNARILVSFRDSSEQMISENWVTQLVDSVPYVGRWVGQVPAGSVFMWLEMKDEEGESALPFVYYLGEGGGSWEIASVGAMGWQMVSLAALDKDAMVWDDDPLFYWWNEQADYGDYWLYQRFTRKNEIEPARGYWYNSLEGRSLPLDSTYEVPEGHVIWKLDSAYTGWNLVANPYGWNIALPKDLEGMDVVRWVNDVADYDSVEYLEPFQAVWVKTGRPMEVALNGEPVFVKSDSAVKPAAKRRALAKAAHREDWSIRPVLTDFKGHADGWNLLGVGSESLSDDPPSGMGDRVNFAIKSGKRYLAKLMKKAQAEGEYSWDVALSATTDRFGYLKFEGLDRVADFGFHLYVTIDGKTSEVLPGDSLRVALKSSETNATVRITNRKLELVESFVGGLHMNMAGGMMKVGFKVDESLAGAPLQVDVLDMDGKVMATYSAKAVAGANTASLIAPKTGLYMLRVRVASHQTAGKVVVK